VFTATAILVSPDVCSRKRRRSGILQQKEGKSREEAGKKFEE
jgi:hypothetical protein